MLHTKTCFWKLWRKRAISILLAVLLVLGSSPAFAQEISLYEDSLTFPVTAGVTYEGKTLFTSLGWQKIHILKVDLSSENVIIDSLLPAKGLSQRDTLGRMVQDSSAVAGINGDFFIMATPSSPIGVQVKDGRLVSSPSNRQDMAAFGLTLDKLPEILRMEFSGKVEAPDGTTFDIGGINKIGDGYSKIFVYTPDFGAATPAVADTASDLTFAIIRNNRIENIVDGKAVDIPKDGLVLAARGDGANFLKSRFSIGDPVKLDLNITPDISNLKMALGGGAVLVENGAVPATFSHNIPGTNPRTAVGFSADKKIMFLVVVDGRQAASRGMTQKELAELMVKLGASFALNLDGGGSSTMAVRPLGEKQPTVINSVSEGVQRLIANGIGIFSKASACDVYGIRIVSSSFNIPKGGHRTFEVRAYDKNYNPVEIDQDSVKWSVTNNLGAFSKNVFYSSRPGYGQVTATLGGIKATQEIKVLSDGAALSVSPGKAQMNCGDKKTFNVIITDVQGFKAPVEPLDIKWEILGNIGDFSAGEFVAGQTPASGAVIANFSGLRTGALLQVGMGEKILEDFEKPDGKEFSSYPSTLGGSFSIVTQPEPVNQGTSSGKLAYEFPVGDSTRAAYVNFSSLSLPAGTVKLSLMVYGQAKGHWLRGTVTDADGNDYNIDFSKNIDWQGWKKVEAELPDGKQPFSLKRIYLVEIDPTDSDSGVIYLDNFSAVVAGKYDESLLPPSSSWYDFANNAAGAGNLVFSATGNLIIDSSAQSQKAASIAATMANQHKTRFNLIAGKSSVSIKLSSASPIATFIKNAKAAGSGYQTLADKEASFIFLDSSKGSFRLTDYNQWIKLRQDLNALPKSKTVFITMDRAPEAFSDALEGELFKKILSENVKNKNLNIWVLCGGANRFGASMENGVHYICLPPTNANEPSIAIFKVSGGNVNYKVVPVIEKIVSETPAAKKGIAANLKVYGISPAGQKMLLSYPYAVDWNLPNGLGGFDFRSLVLTAAKTGTFNLTAKTAGISSSFNLTVVDMTVRVNGREISFPDQQPYLNKDGRTMVPVRFISESLGAKVDWDEKTKTVTIAGTDKSGKTMLIKLRIGENKANVNGKNVTFDTKAEFKNGRTMVPLRFVSEVLGAKVTWDQNTRTVDIDE
ncbi:MAG: stalk domain-containing protein [Tepidanaerobacteraceae bacterium]|jgi:hypothetical protein|nr:stalk domain-containing protein [Tepidanaerobacteraceae bacterium]